MNFEPNEDQAAFLAAVERITNHSKIVDHTKVMARRV